MEQELKEAIARNAASGWCRCWKCGTHFTVDEKIIKCDKSKLQTCSQWYDGYRTALLALDDERIEESFKKKSV